MQGGVVASTFPVWTTTAACCSPIQSYSHTETGRNSTVKLEGRLRPMHQDYMTKDKDNNKQIDKIKRNHTTKTSTNTPTTSTSTSSINNSSNKHYIPNINASHSNNNSPTFTRFLSDSPTRFHHETQSVTTDIQASSSTTATTNMTTASSSSSSSSSQIPMLSSTAIIPSQSTQLSFPRSMHPHRDSKLDYSEDVNIRHHSNASRSNSYIACLDPSTMSLIDCYAIVTDRLEKLYFDRQSPAMAPNSRDIISSISAFKSINQLPYIARLEDDDDDENNDDDDDDNDNDVGDEQNTPDAKSREDSHSYFPENSPVDDEIEYTAVANECSPDDKNNNGTSYLSDDGKGHATEDKKKSKFRRFSLLSSSRASHHDNDGPYGADARRSSTGEFPKRRPTRIQRAIRRTLTMTLNQKSRADSSADVVASPEDNSLSSHPIRTHQLNRTASNASSIGDNDHPSSSSSSVSTSTPSTPTTLSNANLPGDRISLDDSTINDSRQPWPHFKTLLQFVKRRHSAYGRYSFPYTAHEPQRTTASANEQFRRNGSVRGLGELNSAISKGGDLKLSSNQMRMFIANEIYTTECSYLMHLQTLKKCFMDPFIEAADKSRPLVKPADIAIIFAHVPELIRISTKMSTSIKRAVDPWENGKTHLNDIFINFLPELEVYSRYAKNYRDIRLAVDRIDQSEACQKFIRQAHKRKETNKLGLSDYMIMPIQRVTRYCLLLGELKKNTEESHPDFADICQALETMIELTANCNRVTRL